MPENHVIQPSLPTAFFHFSVDDVFDSLIEVSDNNLALFDHPLFAFLEKMHQKYGVNCDLYLFYQSSQTSPPRTLAEIRSDLAEQFQQVPWLRLGPHGLDYSIAPHQQSAAEKIDILGRIYAEIRRFSGADSSSRFIRFHYFSECYDIADYLHSKGVEALPGILPAGDCQPRHPHCTSLHSPKPQN